MQNRMIWSGKPARKRNLAWLFPVLLLLVPALSIILPEMKGAISAMTSDLPVLSWVTLEGLDKYDQVYREAIENLLVRNKVGDPPYFRAGADYDEVWTRDGAFNCWFGGSLLDPVTADTTLQMLLTDDPEYGKVVSPGNGQWWDMIIWAPAAWNHYLVTADNAFLTTACEATINTLQKMRAEHFNARFGLFQGPAFFQDGIAGYPEPLASRKITSSFVLAHPGSKELLCLSTNCLYYQAYVSAVLMARECGAAQKTIQTLKRQADTLKARINRHFWKESSNRYLYFIQPNQTSGQQAADYQEASGLGFALLFGIADKTRMEQICDYIHTETYGIPAVWPSFERFSPERPGRHNVLIWPQVNGIWTKGALAAGRTDLFFPEFEYLTDLFSRSDGNLREIYHPVTGEPEGGWQRGIRWKSCNHQTWSATAYLDMIFHGIFGLRYEASGIRFVPFLPEEWGEVTISGLSYRGMFLTIKLAGRGKTIRSFLVNGEEKTKNFLEGNLKGEQKVRIVMGM